MRSIIAAAGLGALALTCNAAALAPQAGPDPNAVFARINDLVISRGEFEAIFRSAVRHKYYHGKVPAEELETFRRQVTEDIVTQALVHEQAVRLGLQPDRDRINEGIDAFELQNAANPDWRARRDQIVPRLVERLERQDLLEKMEARVRDLPRPGPAEVRRFYRQYPEKFTEPERLRVSVIMLAVPPAAGETAWDEAEARAGELRRRIVAGEDFAALAKRYSTHPSGAGGGAIGYLHEGMLDTRIQRQLESLAVSELGTPLRVLEGVALFRLDGVQPERLRPFAEVEARAAELLYRESRDAAWAAYVDSLRASAIVHVAQ